MEPSTFQQLIDTWYNPLYRFALSLARNGDDALDLTQQTFARWAEKGHTLRDKDRAKSWLFMVLYREFLDSRRLRQREVLGEAEAALDKHAAAKPAAGSGIDVASVVSALGSLDETFRAPVTLFYLESHSYKEIAEILDIPIGTVMSRIARGKEQLRTKLQLAAADSGKVIPMRPVKGESHG
ncbi:MAG: RNA polymerase sigma factor [Verrucomicrobia bacterium]|nr:RNA polymerase sigma factor [Verrucomicrobiota bacterium]